MNECQHEIVFVGMVNVNKDNYLMGVVDVWRCRKCRELFCDDKRYGEALKASVGFEKIEEGEEWGILTCTTPTDLQMNSLGVKLGKKLVHACKDGNTHELVVGEANSIRGGPPVPIHRLYLVKDNINKNIEAGYYSLTMVK